MYISVLYVTPICTQLKGSFQPTVEVWHQSRSVELVDIVKNTSHGECTSFTNPVKLFEVSKSFLDCELLWVYRMSYLVVTENRISTKLVPRLAVSHYMHLKQIKGSLFRFICLKPLMGMENKKIHHIQKKCKIYSKLMIRQSLLYKKTRLARNVFRQYVSRATIIL